MSRAALSKESGFSLIELLVAVALFTVLLGAVFGLLNVSQQRYKMESEFLDSFQTARLAMDQMARDIHSAGYPPSNSFTPAAAAARPQLVALPFAWAPGYSATPCVIGVGCTTPASFDLIVETDLDPQNNNGVEWVRYQLQGTTLFRGVATKTAGADPATATAAALVSYVDNIMNNTTTAQMNLLRTYYATMFPGNTPVPVFTYTCDTSGLPQSCASAAAPFNQPPSIREVNITLIVLAPNPDPKTGQPRAVTLTGLVRRVNPNQ